MRLNQFVFFIALALHPGFVKAQSITADDITGVWQTADKTGEITIFETDGRYSGRISAGTSEEKFDVHNPDKSRRRDPLIGLIILKGLVFDREDGAWKKGTVYDPKNGKHYSCHVALIDKDTLRITGYIGFSWIGRSEEWQRIK